MAAGTAALLLEAEPGLAPSGVRNALLGTASAAGAPNDAAGYGLIDALARLNHIAGIGTARLSKADIVRHRLVQEIVHAYDDSKKRRSAE